MKKISFNPIEPGIKTLWVLDFQRPPSGGLHYDFYIPSPASNIWLKVGSQANYAALEFLGEIQKECKSLKKECQSKKLPSTNIFEKTEEVKRKLDNLDEMIQEFNELLNKFKHPPQEDQPD